MDGWMDGWWQPQMQQWQKILPKNEIFLDINLFCTEFCMKNHNYLNARGNQLKYLSYFWEVFLWENIFMGWLTF